MYKDDLSLSENVSNNIDTYNIFASSINNSVGQKRYYEIPDVVAVGLSGDIVGSTGSIQIAFDKKGEISILVTKGFQGKSDMEGGGAVIFSYSNNADSLDDFTGVAPFFGGGIDFGLPLGPSIEASYSPVSTADGRNFGINSITMGLNGTIAPFDVKTGVTDTDKFGSINILDLFEGWLSN